MNSKIKYMFLGLCLSLGFTACDDVLDETPDNRTEIDTPDKVRQLLTSGYPQASSAVICELSGDNLVDNNVVVPATHNDPYKTFHQEAYTWEDINNYTIGDDDTPYQVWEEYYKGVATCNHAIDAMNRIAGEKNVQPWKDPELAPSWGEAHVLRAYLHFALAMVFAEAYKDDAQSVNDTAIPYVSEPETVVSVDYSQPQYRKSVKELYDLIEKDLLEGIDLIDASVYRVPAYHFNKNAANAFAARFYLAKRDYEKVLQYADAALGENPGSMLRKWSTYSANTINSLLNAYNDELAPCNFLIQTTYSLQDRMLSACRFAINDGKNNVSVESGETVNIPSTKDILMVGGGPNWRGRVPAFDGKIYRWGAGSEYGSWLFNVYEYFEYTDKIAGIGFVHMLYHPFTAEETLMCRAEAKLYLGDMAGAIQDLGYWTASKQVTNELTIEGINDKYKGTPASNIYLSDIHPQQMSAEFPTLDDQATRVLQCILHFRRIDNNFEGLRWFDIKRYGITVAHAYCPVTIGTEKNDKIFYDVLQWNDPRRVLQIPNNVIMAGYPSTNRRPTTSDQNGMMSGNAILVK